MHLKLCIAATLAAGMVACEQNAPTAPATTSRPLVSPTAPRLTGVVLDDRGAPIAGVAVSAALGSSDETDDQGQFYVTTSAPAGVFFALDVYKAGYERRHTYVRGPTEVITLHDVIRLPVGESLRVTISPNDSVGGELEYRFRTVRVVSSTPTGVELSVASDDGGTPDWLLHHGPCCPSPPSVVTSIDDIGSELVATFRVPWWPLVSRTYTLTTRRLGP